MHKKEPPERKTVILMPGSLYYCQNSLKDQNRINVKISEFWCMLLFKFVDIQRYCDNESLMENQEKLYDPENLSNEHE